ncbi:hypothetical protein MTO96_012031 [Rhipicephalus appendiculatus]
MPVNCDAVNAPLERRTNAVVPVNVNARRSVDSRLPNYTTNFNLQGESEEREEDVRRPEAVRREQEGRVDNVHWTCVLAVLLFYFIFLFAFEHDE